MTIKKTSKNFFEDLEEFLLVDFLFRMLLMSERQIHIKN